MIIEIAGLKIKIHSKYKYLKHFCENYEIDDDEFDFEVSGTEDEFEYERTLSPFKNLDRGMYESTCIYRKICLKALDYDAFFMHSAVIAVNGMAYAFLANSGTGKSTHVNLWLNHFGSEEAIIVNGDKPLYRFIDGQLLACGHPWSGKEHWNNNVMVPLAGICFLERGKVNVIRKCSEGETIDRLFHHLLLPDNQKQMDRLLSLLDHMIQMTSAYVLKCNISEAAVKVAYKGMSKGENKL